MKNTAKLTPTMQSQAGATPKVCSEQLLRIEDGMSKKQKNK